jgi:hypothetical protein
MSGTSNILKIFPWFQRRMVSNPFPKDIWNIPYIVYIKVLSWWLVFLGNQEFKVSATVLHCLSQDMEVNVT